MGNHVTNSFFRDIPANFSRYVKRKTKRFNVIPRAERYIDKVAAEKPTKAPSYEATMKLVDKLIKENPESLDNVKKKDEKLHSNLQNIYVNSIGENKDSFSKALIDPSIEKRVYAYEYDDEIPVGKFNTTRAEHFLCAHQANQEIYSPGLLAQIYRIEPTAMRNIVEHVKVLTVIVPLRKKKKSFMENLSKEVVPDDLLQETEDEYLERKLLQATDKFDEFFKVKRAELDRKLSRDMSFLEQLQLVQLKLLGSRKNASYEKKTEKTEEYEIDKSDLTMTDSEALTNYDVVKPEEFDFDKIVNKTKIANVEEKSNSGDQKINDDEGNKNAEDRSEIEKNISKKKLENAN